MPDAGAAGEAWRVPKKPRPSPFWIALAISGVAGLLGFAAVIALSLRTDAPPGAGLDRLTGAELGSAAVVGLALAAAIVAATLKLKLLDPLRSLAAETRFVAEAKSDRAVEPARYRWLAPLPEATAALARALAEERARRESEIAVATRAAEEQKGRLETILRDLTEGVLVCNLEHRVLLYNQAALAQLGLGGELGLGRSLFNLVVRDPVLHALERLRLSAESGGRRGDASPLVCVTPDARTLLYGRLALIRDEAGRATGYVLTLTDATRSFAELGVRDRLLREFGDAMRRPIANLRAATETLSAFPDMAPGQRGAFEAAIQRESGALAARMAELDRATGELRQGSWPMLDILSLDLFRIVAKRCEQEGGPTLVPVGLPQWLHVDSHSLALALELLARLVARETDRRALDIEASLGEGRAYVDLVWSGKPIAAAVIDGWGATAMLGAPGAATLGDVLLRHGSTLWSRAREGGQEAMLRMPLAAPAIAPPATGMRDELPARPEFYDFALLGSAEAGPSGTLRRATFVVFDTETTGLKPSEGDEIVSIGAVRVVNGRILTGETFARLVNPKRTIPTGSIRFHGITDAMVADAPPIEIVLPQLRSFCESAILVAHNAAFDLKFLKLKEAESGVAFDMPALDTLLVSAFLYPDIDDHDLDAIAKRVGVEIQGRHTALGDALATAAVFVRMLDLLEQRGIASLDELMRASRMAYELRQRAAQF